jgi:hypothetical protein
MDCVALQFLACSPVVALDLPLILHCLVHTPVEVLKLMIESILKFDHNKICHYGLFADHMY